MSRNDTPRFHCYLTGRTICVHGTSLVLKLWCCDTKYPSYLYPYIVLVHYKRMSLRVIYYSRLGPLLKPILRDRFIIIVLHFEGIEKNLNVYVFDANCVWRSRKIEIVRIYYDSVRVH